MTGVGGVREGWVVGGAGVWGKGVGGEMEWSCGSLLSLLGHLEGQFGHGGVYVRAASSRAGQWMHSRHVRKVRQLHIYQLIIPLSTTTTLYYSPGQASLVETILIPDIFLVFNCSVGALKSGVLGREARRRGRSALRSMYVYGRGSGRGQFVSER